MNFKGKLQLDFQECDWQVKGGTFIFLGSSFGLKTIINFLDY